MKEFIRYTALNVLGMVGLSCYILADTFFIAQGIGADGLTALNLAIPIYSFINGTGLMLGMGGATKYMVFKGQKKKENLTKVFSHTIDMAAIASFLFVLAGIFLPELITHLLGANESVFEMTKTYLQVILLFAPFFMLNNVLNCFVRNDGNPRLSMLAMLLGSFSNIILDYVFLFPMKMGIFGAVLATGLAPVIGILILLQHWRTKENQLHLKKMRVDASLASSVIVLGIPSLITEVASGVVMLVFNFIILRLKGNIGVAAYGIVANLSLIVASVYTGVAQGMQPLTSAAYGGGDKQKVKMLYGYAKKTLLVLSVLMYAIILVFAEPIAMVFNKEANMQLQQMAVEGLRIYFLAALFMGFNTVTSLFFISVERPVPAQLLSLLRGLFLIVPAAFVMAACFGMKGVWFAFPLTELTVSLLGVIAYRKYF